MLPVRDLRQWLCVRFPIKNEGVNGRDLSVTVGRNIHC